MVFCQGILATLIGWNTGTLSGPMLCTCLKKRKGRALFNRPIKNENPFSLNYWCKVGRRTERVKNQK